MQPEVTATLTYQHGTLDQQPEVKTTTKVNLYGLSRNEFTNEILKDFVRACGFYVGIDEELYFENYDD